MGRVVRGRRGEQPWDRPQAPLERGEGGAQLWDRPQALPGGRWRVGGQPWDSPLLQSRQGGAREAGAVAGGREVYLCGAPSGLPLRRFCEWKHLQMCCGGR